jgi:acetyl esterase/lipase
MPRPLLFCLAAFLFMHPAAAADGEVVPLWKHGPPGFESRRNIPEQAHDYWVKSINNPSLTVFLPPQGKATGTAVVIVPGGGHRELVFNAEGIDPAKYFQQLGVAAFALKYRLALEPGSPYQIERDALADVQRAIRLVRSRATEWGVDPARVGVMGWSAGGELAAMVTYGPNNGDPEAIDPVNRLSCRPDFQIVIYPGPRGVPDRFEAKPPPAFFLAAGDDTGPSRTITRLLELYRVADVPAEVHIYAQGHHAFNMGYRSDLVSIKDWPQRLTDWMTDSGLLTNRQSAH